MEIDGFDLEKYSRNMKENAVIENGVVKVSEELWNQTADLIKAVSDLEEQGLLIRLPCKVGDTVYSLDKFCGGYSSDCPSRPCEQCPDYQLEIYEGKFQLNDIYDFGKTVFLTRELAEKALKKMNETEE
jgi:hypothetical protein